MATLEQLEAGLRKAYDSGNMEYARILGDAIVAARKNPVNLIPGNPVEEAGAPQQEPPSLTQKVYGGLETMATLGSGMTGGAAGMVGGALKGLAGEILSGNFGTRDAQERVEAAALEGARSLTYVPRSETGQEMAQAAGEFISRYVPPLIPAVGAPGAILSGARQAAPAVASAAARANEQIGRGMAAARGAARRATDRFGGGDGMPPDSPYGGVGAEALPLAQQRYMEAEKAGFRLSEGELKRDPGLLGWEKEKAKSSEYQEPFVLRSQENNRQALLNLESLIDDTGAETGTLTDTGIKVVDTLMKGYRKEKAKTTAKYNEFRQSPEAQLLADVTQVIDFINAQPVKIANVTGVTDVARHNAVGLGIARIDSQGKLVPNQAVTLGQMEEFRQSIGAIKPMSPNDRRLIKQTKDAIDAGSWDVGGDLTKAMRAQRRRQGELYENRAIIARLLLEKKGWSSDPQTPIEDVFNKTILLAKPSEIRHAKNVLLTIGEGEGKQAWRELQGAMIRHIESGSHAGIGTDNLPVVSAAKLNKIVSQLDKNGKLDLVLGKRRAENIRNLNQVLQYIQTVPPHTPINNSGTARTLMALLVESGMMGATTGVPLPVVQGVRMLQKQIKDRKINARIEKALNYKPEGVE